MKKQELKPEEIDEKLKVYLQYLLEKKGMTDLPPKVLGDMLVDLYSRFSDMLLLNILKAVPTEKQDELDEKLQSGASEEEMQEFLSKNIENYTRVMVDTRVEFEKIFLES